MMKGKPTVMNEKPIATISWLLGLLGIALITLYQFPGDQAINTVSLSGVFLSIGIVIMLWKTGFSHSAARLSEIVAILGSWVIVLTVMLIRRESLFIIIGLAFSVSVWVLVSYSKTTWASRNQGGEPFEGGR